MRRRATSLSATAPNVITTDRVRPDWAKKLADARAQALRRSAAATALHTAAYMLGGEHAAGASGSGHSSSRSALRLGGRSRRMILVDGIGNRALSPRNGDSNEGGSGTENTSSRQRVARVEDLEELMMLEAIRQSLLAEEERKAKSDSEAAKGNAPTGAQSSQPLSEFRPDGGDNASSSSVSLSPSPSPAASASSQQQGRDGEPAGMPSESSAFLTVPTTGARSVATSSNTPQTSPSDTSSPSSASTAAAPESKVSFRSLAAMVGNEDKHPPAAGNTRDTNGGDVS
jgi:hypothetical protein